MTRISSLFFVLFSTLCLGISSSLPASASLNITRLESNNTIDPIPDASGRAGMAAAVVHDQGGQFIIALGGANFPDGLPWENGKKVFYKDILKMKDGKWAKIGELPSPVAYAASSSTSKGMIIAGGCSEAGHSNQVFLIQPDGKFIALPSLPKTLAYPAFTTLNNRLYVIGGQEKEDSTTASKSIYLLDLNNIDPANPEKATWETLKNRDKQTACELPTEGSILSTASALNGKIYIMGGCSLSPDSEGIAKRTYLDKILVLNPTSQDERWLKEEAKLPFPLAGSATPAPAREGKIIIIGGDNGSHYGKTPQTHPGQTNAVLVYSPKDKTWETSKNNASIPEQWIKGPGKIGLATAPALIMGNTLYTISGETAPGIRTAAVGGASLSYSLSLEWIDWLIFSLGILVFTILCFQIRKHGISNIAVAIAPGSKPGTYAWVVVGLLWVVAMLNYLDRQLLTTIREPIVNDIPQTEAQFGLLTAVFLFIYSALSPIGGFLADRFSRRVVILCSLLVWSTVTWMTGHVHDYQQLFIARALMGISEACYIPAALALITDYHRGRTRSLATGIHMSGVYLGMALAGYGGHLAEITGWRLTFGLFGFVGVAYALILTIFLKDPKAEAETSVSLEETKGEAKLAPVEKPSISSALRSLFSQPSFWLLLIIMAGAGAANWLVLAWFPTLLKEKFNLTLGDAGIHATFWNTLAKYIAVIGGAIIADKWAMTNLKGRQLLPGIAFCVAAPLIGASALIGNFSFMDGIITGFGVFVAFIAFQGLAQGALDATLMPVLRSHIDERFSATGYGFLNLVSAGVGGLTVLLGGNIRDAGFDLTDLFAASSIMIFVCGLCLLFMPKPKDKLISPPSPK